MQVETVIERNDAPDRGEILRKGFRMGEWIVRPIEGLIDGRLGSRHLQPKSMDVLLCLACTPNHIVERDGCSSKWINGIKIIHYFFEVRYDDFYFTIRADYLPYEIQNIRDSIGFDMFKYPVGNHLVIIWT